MNEVKTITINRVSNGFVVSVHSADPKKQGKYVFDNVNKMMAFVHSLLVATDIRTGITFEQSETDSTCALILTRGLYFCRFQCRTGALADNLRFAIGACSEDWAVGIVPEDPQP